MSVATRKNENNLAFQSMQVVLSTAGCLPTVHGAQCRADHELIEQVFDHVRPFQSIPESTVIVPRTDSC